jgi:TolA-binding protein
MAKSIGVSLSAAFLLAWAAASAQMTPDQAAELLLTGARQAYNEKNYPFAITRFREFLSKYGNHKDAAEARYGLALSLLRLPELDFGAALEQLQPIAGKKDFAEYPFVLYYLGQAQRGLGIRDLSQHPGKPEVARPRFDEAARHFGAAAAAFTARAKAPAPDAKELPPDLEWAARARCDQAEMLLRNLKVREALTAVAGLVNDPTLQKSRSRNLGLYYHGFACFVLKDYLAAGKSLNQLTPFTDPAVGTHARYMLARIHHLSDERPEAAAQYEAVISGHARDKQTAAEALKHPEKFKDDPGEKARLEALVRDAPPGHVARATFYLGVIQYENGQFGDAAARFLDFTRQFPKSPFFSEAQLRHGFCQVQLKQYGEAQRTLQPLADREPKLADQALLWLARAQAGAADPNNAAAREQALRAAMDTLRRAAEKAQQVSTSDPDARARKGEILLELADIHQEARQYREAAGTYAQLLGEKLLPQRDEEVLERQATALHLAGDFAESDKVCQRFQSAYPKSTLLPNVLFRHAENAHFQGLAAEKAAGGAGRPETARLFEEAGKRYQLVVDKYPESPYVHLARHGLAMICFRKQDYEKAKQILEAIPQPERNGELAVVSYTLADCLMRLAPARADDAVAAGRLEELLQTAAELLDGFVAAHPQGLQTADALLKLGLCHQRLAALLANPPEKAKALASARGAYERLMQQFPRHALQPQAVFERAKCLADAGDRGGATNELMRFTQDPLRATSIAPMALVRLSLLLRSQNRSSDAAILLAQCRQQHEAALRGDPARAGWLAVLQYHQGMALKDAGKLAEARGVFEQIAHQSPDRPEAAEAVLRYGQCLKEEALPRLTASQKVLAQAKNADESAAAQIAAMEAAKALQDVVSYLDKQAEQLKVKMPAAEPRLRLLYEAAWGYRSLAEMETALARARQVGSKGPAQPEGTVPMPPSEQKARERYQTLLATAPDAPLGVDARLELAELLTERGEHEPAIKLLTEALDKEPSAQLTDKIRLRLGACHAGRKDVKAALAQFQAVAQNPKSPLAPQAQYRAGECHLEMGQWSDAVKFLVVFRDQAPFRDQPGLTDRALLRLGHALAHLKQWDQSRQAHELVVARFGQSPWVHEARYGIGWAWQNQRQFDNAVGAYSQVVAGTATSTAAKAQLQIGLCRLEQKRYAEASTALLVVPYTYDYPELNAVALCEAARALAEQKQRPQAEKLLLRVIKEHPKSQWAAVAKERLESLRGG